MAIADVVKAITVTAELTGASMSGAAIAVMAQDLLTAYPEESVMRALVRCRKELSRPLTAGAVFERLADADGRPGVEEAWAMCPKSEADSVCWTLEMKEAYRIARSLAEDAVGARMAFKDAYTRLVRESRENGFPARWELSLGWDEAGRRVAVEKAVEVKALTSQAAVALLPPPPGGVNLLEHLTQGAPLLIQGPETTPQDAAEIRRRVAGLKAILASSGAKKRAAQEEAARREREDLEERKAKAREAVRDGLS